MKSRPDPARVRAAAFGVVALTLFAGAVAFTGFVLKGGLVSGFPVKAVFAAPGVGQQLPVGGDVKVRGVLVGRIQDIRLEGQNAVVFMRLEHDVALPESTRAEIRSKTIFGEKWVQLIPSGEEGGELLRAGSVIPDERTREPLELERALQLGHDLISEIPLQRLAALFEALAEGFSGQEADARRAMDRGLIALRAVNSRSEGLDTSLRQLREFSQWLDDNDTDLLSFMDSLDTANRALVGAAPEFRSSLQSVPVALDDFAAFQERIESDLGRLVEDGATVAEIVAARSDRLRDIVIQLEPFTTVWNSGLSQPCSGLFESNLTCWQVYQLPGLDSRGLYNGRGPHRDGAGDPVLSRAVAAMSEDAFAAALSDGAGAAVPDDVAQVLFSFLRSGAAP